MTERALHRGRPDLLYVPDKDPDFVYHWFNAAPSQHGDFNMTQAQWEGWEPVEDDKTIPTEVLSRAGQQVSAPAGGSVRRGDLVLYRMPKEQWERTVHADTEKALRKQEVTLDTMVTQAQESAAKALRDRGQKRIPGNLVFREDVGDPT